MAKVSLFQELEIDLSIKISVIYHNRIKHGNPDR